MGKLILVLLLLTSACSRSFVLGDGYRRTMLATSSALVVCDWGMTRWMPKSGAYEDGFVELNPLLGRQPSTRTIDAVFVVALAAHVGAYRFMPKWMSAWWYTTVTAVEAANVAYFNPSGVCGDFGRVGR